MSFVLNNTRYYQNLRFKILNTFVCIVVLNVSPKIGMAYLCDFFC